MKIYKRNQKRWLQKQGKHHLFKFTDEELRELLPSGKKQFLEIESHGPELTW